MHSNGNLTQVVCKHCGYDKVRTSVFPVFCKCGATTLENGECIPPRSRGLGDTLAKLTKAIGIKPCGGCKERQVKLNELFPYS